MHQNDVHLQFGRMAIIGVLSAAGTKRREVQFKSWRTDYGSSVGNSDVRSNIGLTITIDVENRTAHAELKYDYLSQDRGTYMAKDDPLHQTNPRVVAAVLDNTINVEEWANRRPTKICLVTSGSDDRYANELVVKTPRLTGKLRREALFGAGGFRARRLKVLNKFFHQIETMFNIAGETLSPVIRNEIQGWIQRRVSVMRTTEKTHLPEAIVRDRYWDLQNRRLAAELAPGGKAAQEARDNFDRASGNPGKGRRQDRFQKLAKRRAEKDKRTPAEQAARKQKLGKRDHKDASRFNAENKKMFPKRSKVLTHIPPDEPDPVQRMPQFRPPRSRDDPDLQWPPRSPW